MSPRKVVPRSARSHEVVAGNVLERYCLAQKWTPSLPVPVDRIVEHVYNLTILYEALDEPPGETLLGVLQPEQQRIVLNERHLDLFEDVIGPERFTLAHELGHWLYDADDPAQGSLFAGTSTEPATIFCRGLNQSSGDLRETNANKFAACLLLPGGLVKAAVTEPFPTWGAVTSTAAVWGISRRTLEIRLETLGLADYLPS